jgi:transcriptional regulator with XRE-family HTH domain
MSDFYNKLGKKLKTIRERLDISQDTLAKKLNLPRPAISQIERGERTVTADELIKLSSVFRVPIDAILDLKKEPEVILSKTENIKHPRSPKKVKEKSQIRINVPQKNLEKFKEVLLYILQRVGSRPNIGETVIYKLLYFMDFNYYEKYEEQLIGAQYQKNRYGPTPVEFAKITERMINDGDIEKVKSKYFNYPQTKYLPIRKPDLSKLSATELEVIEDVLNRLSDMNAQQISDYSHGDVPWRTTEEGTVIEYEAVFYRTAPYSVREYPEDVS